MFVVNVADLEKARDVEGLIAALGDADPYVRQNAARALGRIGDKAAVEPLNSLLADTHSYDPAESHRGDRAFQEMGDDEPVYPVRLAAREALDWIASGNPPLESGAVPPEPPEVPPFQVGDIVEAYRHFSVEAFYDGADTGLGNSKWKVLSIGPEQISLLLVEGQCGDFVPSGGKFTYFRRDPGFIKNMKNSNFYTKKFPDRKPYQEVLDSFRKVG
jgi:hypothetical protein